jgi:hypothetical protein
MNSWLGRAHIVQVAADSLSAARTVPEYPAPPGLAWPGARRSDVGPRRAAVYESATTGG